MNNLNKKNNKKRRHSIQFRIYKIIKEKILCVDKKTILRLKNNKLIVNNDFLFHKQSIT